MLLQLVILTALALLWMLSLTNIGGTDFLKVTVFRYGASVMRTQDMLVGIAILCLMISVRGPLMITAGALFCVWLLTLLGIPQLFGVEISPVVIIMIVVGVCVHIVTHRDQ